MKELSIFVDESGDFGIYHHHSPYYIISMVFHDQQDTIEPSLKQLEYELSMLGFPKHCVHTGPIIRQEEEYKYYDLSIRRKIFNKLVAFLRQTNIRHTSFHIAKKQFTNTLDITEKLSKLISNFVDEHYSYFISFSSIKIYYDNGQTEVSRLLRTVFHSKLSNVEFRRVIPSNYRLFQTADLVCTLYLLQLKMNAHSLSKSELLFFGTERDLKKNYLRQILSKKL